MKHPNVCNWIRRINLPDPENHLYNLHQPFSRIINKAHQIRNAILFTFVLLGFGQVCWGQVSGDYGSIATGIWSAKSSWGIYDGTSFVGPIGSTVALPSASKNVFINSTHTITLDGSTAFVKNLTINGTLSGGINLLYILGNFINNGIFISSGTGKVDMKSVSSTLVQTIGGTTATPFANLTISNIKLPVTASKSFSISGTFTCISSLCSFIPNSDVVITGLDGSDLTFDGTVKVTRTEPYLTDTRGNYLSQYNGFNGGRTVSIVEYSGSASQVISDIATYTNLKIYNSSGCTLYGNAKCTALNIEYGILTLNPGSTLTALTSTNLGSAKCLVVQSSSASAMASFINGNAGASTDGIITGSGTILVERFMSKSDYWHLYCSPIKDQNIHEFLKDNLEIPDLLDGNGNVIGVGMRQYLTDPGKWDTYYVYGSGDDGSMADGKGFSIRGFNEDSGGSGMIYATGLPNSSTSVPMVTTANGWNCIGNPFTCALDVGNFLNNSGDYNNTNKELIDPAFGLTYRWDPTLLSGNGAYTTDNSSLPTGQGFFIKSSGVDGSVTFDPSMMKSNAGLTFKSADIDLPSIQIFVENQKLISATKVEFLANATKGLDRGYDAGMLKANPDFALYSHLLEDSNVDFTTQCLPDKNYDQYVIPIGIDCKVAGELTFTAETVNLPSGCQALLEDRLTKRFTRLDLKDAKYTATVSADTKGTGRFYLHTSDVISSAPTLEESPFNIYTVGKTVYINGEVGNQANFSIYSVSGKQMANFTATSQVQNTFDATGISSGVYILTVDDKKQKKSVKFVIEN